MLTKFGQFNSSFAIWFNRIAAVAVLLMIAVTFVDVVSAKVFRLPIRGALELVSLSQVVAIAGAMAFTQIAGRHVAVEVLTHIMPKRVRTYFSFLTSLLASGLFALVGWQMLQYGLGFRSTGQITGSGLFPFFPFAWWVALSCIPMCLVLLMKALNSLLEAVKK